MITAEDFLENYKNYTDHYTDQEYSGFKLIEALQEFAKLHVEAALKQASEKVLLTIIDHEEIRKGSFRPIWGTDSDSILNAYPLENIK